MAENKLGDEAKISEKFSGCFCMFLPLIRKTWQNVGKEVENLWKIIPPDFRPFCRFSCVSSCSPSISSYLSLPLD